MKKLIVITGASSGFGMALAKQFSKDDYPLLLLARRVEKNESIKPA
jgi:short-subunit dehydrogenase